MMISRLDKASDKQSYKKFYGTQWGQASITVFLTILFVMILALILTVIESTRVMTSKSYVAVSGQSAAMVTYGNYNQELYEKYHLLGYGGYEGKGVIDWEQEMKEVLSENLAAVPKDQVLSYTDLYRFGRIRIELQNPVMLTDQKELLSQMRSYLLTNGILRGKDAWVHGTEECSESVGEAENSTHFEKQVGDCDAYENQSKDKKEDGSKVGTVTNQETEQKTKIENPFTAFRELTRDGILGLVCPEKEVSKKRISIDREVLGEGAIESGTSEEGGSWGEGFGINDTKKGEELSAIKDSKNLLERFLDKKGTLKLGQQGSKVLDKVMLIQYAWDVFPCYIDHQDKVISYGIEYLLGGKEDERDNLICVVNKLLFLRTMMNFLYVDKDESLRAQALAMAMALVGLTMVTPIVKAVQSALLLLLSIEESFVDIRALLDDREVPFSKDITNFQMKFSELFLSGPTFFQKKAEKYPKAEKTERGILGLFSISKMNYRNYLSLFLFAKSKDTLLQRSCQLIQYDLRERYNQTFLLRDCICGGDINIQYSLPPFYGIRVPDWERKVEIRYGYKPLIDASD